MKKLLLLELPELSPAIWTQTWSRALFQAGQGLLQFYIPIVFVNQVGLSATAVGIGVGTASLSGAVGYFFGGSLADCQQWGRKGTLLLAGGLSLLATCGLACSNNVPLLLGANLMLGFGFGFYWPAADAAIADLTASGQRHQAYALLNVAENLSIGAGILGGGILWSFLAQGKALFWLDSLPFVAFMIVIQTQMAETGENCTSNEQAETSSHAFAGWLVALKDKPLWLFVIVNLLFTTYAALATSTLPLYFTNFILDQHSQAVPPIDFAPMGTVGLFGWHLICASLLQLPIARALGAFLPARGLLVAILLWGSGFGLVWVTGWATSAQFPLALVALGVLAGASVAYKPLASSLVAELAPAAWRGVYAAIASQCWTFGDFFAPILGGWSLDRSPDVAHHLWGVAALTTLGGLLFLPLLERYLVAKTAIETVHASDRTQESDREVSYDLPSAESCPEPLL